MVLVAIPMAAFVLPDLIRGRLLITGDNLQQNLPLHVLVGSMLRHGQLPFWNEYIFSGSPLMADFNAGAFYPLMGLFVILPDRAAWIATEVVLFSGDRGRHVRLSAAPSSSRRSACILAAATFAFAGPVLSQVNHVDMTEGYVAIPWMLLAVFHIVRDGRWRWSILLGMAFATVILAGAPEAMLDEALMVIAYAAFSAGLNARALVARPQPLWCRRGAGPFACGHPVATGTRGHPELPTRQRRARRRGELSDAVQHLLRSCPTSTAGTATSARRNSSASTTCPRSGSTWACCRSSPW